MRGQVRDSGSPPQSTVRPCWPFHPASMSIFHIVGVPCATVARRGRSPTGSDRPPRRDRRGGPRHRPPRGGPAPTRRCRTTKSSLRKSRRRHRVPADPPSMQEVDDVAVRDCNPLRSPGRARREDHVREVAPDGRRTGDMQRGSDSTSSPRRRRQSDHRATLRPACRRAATRSAMTWDDAITVVSSASSTMIESRSDGKPGSIGTYPTPHFHAPTMATTMSTVRSRAMPTRSPGLGTHPPRAACESIRFAHRARDR